MTSAIADLARRRPYALLATAGALLLVAAVLAAGAPDRLGIGFTRLSDRGAGPDLTLVTRGDVPASSRVYHVALSVISSSVGLDSAVESVQPGPASGQTATLKVDLRSGDPAVQEQAVERILATVDPGPLRLAAAGDAAVAIDARNDLQGQLWKLELLVLPLAALVLAGTLGLRLGLATTACAGFAVAGTLAVMRLLGGPLDLSLLGIAPGAVVGLVLGIELPALLIARYADDVRLAGHDEALRRTVAHGLQAGSLVVAAAIAGGAGLLTTPLDQAGSILLAVGVAAGLAALAALVVIPALLSLAWVGAEAGAGRSAGAVARIPGRLAAWLGASRPRIAIACVVAVGALGALAVPALDGHSAPMSAEDLPAGSDARTATRLLDEADGGDARAEEGRGGQGQSLFEDLPLAAATSLAALALVLLGAFRAPRAALAAIPALLPAAAGAGLAVLAFEKEGLADVLGQDLQPALETGGLAALLVALAAVGGARTIMAVATVRGERELGIGADRAAALAAGVTVPGVLAATLVAGAATAVLAGAHLYPAREFGIAVAAALLLDLLLVRVPQLAALARWGG